VCVTATKGEAGSQNQDKWPTSELGSIRENELAQALDVIGVKNHHWLGYKDGLCENIDKKEASKKIAELFKKYKPDTVLTFGKDGMTGHSDHCCVSCWVDDALELSGINSKIFHAVHTIDQYNNYLKYMDKELNIFFNIDKPPIVGHEDCDIYLELDDSLKSIKLKALSQMPSQTEIMLSRFNQEFIGDALASEAFVLSR
jgi:LmbE family N-acetylglucosaminyl deacetylase